MAEQTESNWTESRFRQRLVGASVVVALAVLLLPLWLDGSGIDSLRVQSVPDKPEVKDSGEIDIPKPPGDSGEPLEQPPQSLFPDQTPIEARPGGDSEAMSEPMEEETIEPAQEKTVEVSTSEPSTESKDAAPDEKTPSSGSSSADKSPNEEQASTASDDQESEPEKPSEDKEGESAGKDSTEAASLPESSTDGEFVVQLGSFSDERNARALAESVESSGFDVFVTPLFSEQGTVWRVRVGPYSTREQAGEATDRLRQRIGRDGLVMTK